MSNSTTPMNNTSNHPMPSTSEANPQSDATHLTTTSSSATGTPTVTTPSDPALNSSNVNAPLVSQLREAPVDPRVVALRAMFPDYDDLVLQSVLDSVGGDQDRAIDALLAMSDPDYTSEVRPAESQPISQTELDEEFARRLMLEDQQRQQTWATQQSPQRPQRSPRSSQQPPPGTAPSNGGGDTMGEFQQQFNKIAESGKKTFGTIFSKVKAKIQEFDQPKPDQGYNGGTQPTWGSSSGNDASQYQPFPQGGQPYPVRRQTYPAPQAQQPAYYDPNGYTPTQPDRIPSPPITLSPAPPKSTVQGYDITPDPPSANYSTRPVAGTTTGTTSSPPRPQGAPIDGVKLGLLPKRPVSLLRPDSPAGSPHQIQRSASDDDSDDLEYTESPFEERKK